MTGFNIAPVNVPRFAALCVIYTLAFVLLSAALQAENEKTGETKINFEYRAF